MQKKLFDPFSERKIHKKIIPPLGGVAIFIGLTLSSMIWTYGKTNGELKYIIAAVIIMFFVGLKDDLIDISARKKLVVQIIAALMLIAFGNIRFTNLHGLFGVEEIGMGLSIVISLFTIIVIVNAFNLIDGIDGLASGLAIVCSALLGVWFYYVGIGVFSILSFALAGSLTGFFFYNVFGDRHKLFLGDTGSLIVGLIIAVLIIKFNEINLHYRGVYSVTNAPAISFALIAVPLVDTLRVMTIRILQKRSPFSADKNHIHHRILYFYDKHIVVTCFLIVCNLAFFAIAYQLGKTNLSVTINLILIIMISITILNMPAVLRNLAESKKNVPVLNPKKSFFEQIFFWYG